RTGCGACLGGPRWHAGSARAPPPRLSPPPLQLPPSARDALVGPEAPGPLSLRQASDDEGRSPTPRGLEQLAQAVLGHDGVLVLAEDVLELLGLLDEPHGGPTRGWRRQLRRVARALRLDPQRVQLGVAGLLR